mgnify:CR=1 FL=1
MSRAVVGIGWVGLAGVVSGGLLPLPGHWDVTPTYSVGSQEWSWLLVDGPVSHPPETAFFPGYDGDYFDNEGERIDRPSGSQWDFIGVAAGEPVWIFPEATTYGTQAEPGFGETQSGVFSGNLEVRLAGVDGPQGADFSMFDNGGTYMATSDGIDASDLLLKPAFHSHQNWAFTSKGMWRVRLQVMGYLGPGATNPTPLSAEVPLHFAIGGVARWRAEHFDAAVVMDEAVAGPDADPDGDRLVNLVEYALGGDPGDATGSDHGAPVAPEVGIDGGRLTISFHRRSAPPADEGISISVEWADSLGGPWQAGGSQVDLDPAASGWERVTMRDAAPSPGDRRFARVRVVQTP